MRLGRFLSRTYEARALAPRLWVDLTGNALSALSIKLAGAKNLAARITRGGSSLVDYALPHSIQENEYANRGRIAQELGCTLDFSVADRLRGQAITGFEDIVVLCFTTAARWKNWPLLNARRLIERFPKTHFVLVGLRREIQEEEADDLHAILRLSNVRNGLDTFSTYDLVRLIAHAVAVVTVDTSVAHIANFFGIHGAVLFGPVSPNTFASADGLKVFHDATCAFHPCVQWKCSNQANWCMQKISPRDVGNYLATLPGFAN